MLRRRTVLKGIAASAAAGVLTKSFPRPAIAADVPLKIGCSMPLTGAGFAAVGKLLSGAIKVYQAQHGDTVAGRKIEMIIHDDSGNADNARRLVQDMIVNDKIDMVAMGITPCTLAVAPLVTEAKKATLVHELGRFHHHDQVALFLSRRLHHRAAGLDLRRMGDQERQSSASSRWSTNGRRAPKRSRRSRRASRNWAARSSSRCACRWRAPISRRPCSASRTSSPIPPSSIFPGPLAPVFTRQFAGEGPRPDRHQDFRAGRSVRRRQPRQCRRPDDRADHRRLLHGGARFAAEQAVSGRLHQAEQPAARRLHLARRL